LPYGRPNLALAGLLVIIVYCTILDEKNRTPKVNSAYGIFRNNKIT